jgi:DNA-binding MarR family transcriptional regulator
MKNPLRDLPGYALRRASTTIMAALAPIVAKHDLRVSEASVLMVIAENPSARQSDIGRLLGIQRANMTPLIARLEKQSLVERLPMDGRSHALGLTRGGQKKAQELQTAVAHFENDLLAKIPPEERARFLRHLTALSSAAHSFAAAE